VHIPRKSPRARATKNAEVERHYLKEAKGVDRAVMFTGEEGRPPKPNLISAVMFCRKDTSLKADRHFLPGDIR
jgi:hypothetical protein